MDAGLAKDPDTSHFLRGVLLKSSTYTNYESHTAPEAQYHLYSILKPLAVEVKLRQVQAIRKSKTGYIYTATPETNHHAVFNRGIFESKGRGGRGRKRYCRSRGNSRIHNGSRNRGKSWRRR